MTTAPQLPDPNQPAPWGAPAAPTGYAPPQTVPAQVPAAYSQSADPQAATVPHGFGYTQAPAIPVAPAAMPSYGSSAHMSQPLYGNATQPAYALGPYAQSAPVLVHPASAHGSAPDAPSRNIGLWIAVILAATIVTGALSFVAIQLTSQEPVDRGGSTSSPKASGSSPQPGAAPKAASSKTVPAGNSSPTRTAAPVIKWQSSENVKYVPGGMGRAQDDYVNLTASYIDPTSEAVDIMADDDYDFGTGQDGALESQELDDVVVQSVNDSGDPYDASMIFQEIPPRAGYRFKFASNDYDAYSAAQDQYYSNGASGEAPSLASYRRWIYAEVVKTGDGKFAFRYSDKP